jgi:hypothetical protein
MLMFLWLTKCCGLVIASTPRIATNPMEINGGKLGGEKLKTNHFSLLALSRKDRCSILHLVQSLTYQEQEKK